MAMRLPARKEATNVEISDSTDKAAERRRVRVVIGSDVYPGGRAEPFFRRGDSETLFGNLQPILVDADLTIVNLECPLVESPRPISKSGPVLSGHPESVNGLCAAGVGLVALANNHVLDHGEEGLASTISCCEKNGLAPVGAGPNLHAARQPFIRTIRGTRIGVVAMADREFSIATETSWGANPLSVMDFVRLMAEIRSEIDYLIVLLHGGNEHYPYPSPAMMDAAHFLVEQGANLVINQHTHCPGCYESYLNSTIVYGQGNLVFDWQRMPASWYEGFLVTIDIRADLTADVHWVPYTQFAGHIGARRMEPRREEAFLAALAERSTEIRDAKRLQERWNSFCSRQSSAYLSLLLAHNRPLTLLNRWFPFVTHVHSRRALTAACNVVRCEAHRETLLTLLENDVLKRPR